MFTEIDLYVGHTQIKGIKVLYSVFSDHNKINSKTNNYNIFRKAVPISEIINTTLNNSWFKDKITGETSKHRTKWELKKWHIEMGGMQIKQRLDT